MDESLLQQLMVLHFLQTVLIEHIAFIVNLSLSEVSLHAIQLVVQSVMLEHTFSQDDQRQVILILLLLMI
jgi:hypothetical protein